MTIGVEPSGSNISKDPNVRVTIGKTSGGFKEVLANTVDCVRDDYKKDPTHYVFPLALSMVFSQGGLALTSFATAPTYIAAPLASTDMTSPLNLMSYVQYKETVEKKKKLTPPS